MSRNLFLAYVILFLISPVYGQTVPNGNFEGPPFQWSAIVQGGILSIGSSSTVELLEGKDTTLGTGEGRSSARMVNDDKSATLQTRTKFPIDKRPTYFGFLHNYYSHGQGEKGYGRLLLTKLNSSTQEIDTILDEKITLENAVLDWSRISIDLTDKYKSTETPDSAHIEFVVSEGAIITPKTFLMIDDILLIAPTVNTRSSILENQLAFFPNPLSEGKVQIEFNTSYIGPASLLIFDKLGRLVHSTNFEKRASGSFSKAFDLSMLATGSYTATLRMKDQMLSEKLLIN